MKGQNGETNHALNKFMNCFTYDESKRFQYRNAEVANVPPRTIIVFSFKEAMTYFCQSARNLIAALYFIIP